MWRSKSDRVLDKITFVFCMGRLNLKKQKHKRGAGGGGGKEELVHRHAHKICTHTNTQLNEVHSGTDSSLVNKAGPRTQSQQQLGFFVLFFLGGALRMLGL